MEKLKRYLNIYRKEIYKAILIIISIYIILRVINYYYEQRNIEEYEEKLQNSTENTVEEELDVYSSNDIERFIELCKSANISKAYSMLSDKTKEEYKTEEIFGQKFITEFLNAGNQYEIHKPEKAYKIYEIDVYNGDILSTGDLDNVKAKYIAIDNKKIEIQDYLYSKEFDKNEIKYNDISFIIKKVTYYYNYSEYNIFVSNQGSNALNIQNMYFLSETGTKYNKIDNEIIKIGPYESKSLNEKFNIAYNNKGKIRKLVIETDNDQLDIDL